MFIAMNRFKIVLGKENDFENVWKNRDSYLDGVPGFKQFNLLKGSTTSEFTLYSSHTIWASEEDFLNWTKSESFRNAHKDAGKNSILYIGHPVFEGLRLFYEKIFISNRALFFVAVTPLEDGVTVRKWINGSLLSYQKRMVISDIFLQKILMVF